MLAMIDRISRKSWEDVDMEGLFGLLILAGIGFGLYKLVMKMGLETHLRNSATKEAAERIQALRQPHIEERAKQFIELQAALPSAPPERMRATIRVDPVIAFTNLRKHGSGTPEKTEITCYAVDLILEFSERDRATVLQYQLDQIVFETIPAFRDDEIIVFMDNYEEEYNRHSSTSRNGLLVRAMMDQQKKSFNDYRAEKREITLADYMKSPFTRIFRTLSEANDYSDELKTNLLLKVKTLLDRNLDRKTTETVEF
jgi:hypothetical protein